MFVGGGSGGHFYPLLAVAEELVNMSERPALYYIGPTPFAAEALTQLGITYVWCPAGKQRRYFSLLNFTDPFKTFFGIFVAIWKLYVIYPDVIFSKGSFVSVPVLIAARLLRIPVVIHESDTVPGRANLLAKKFARYIAISYPEAAAHFPSDRTALVGIPIRRAITTPPADPFAVLNIPNDRPLLLVTGGSLGAEYLNNAVLQTLPELLTQYQVFHLAGSTLYESLRLTAKAYITDPELQRHYYLEASVTAEVMAALYTAATLVISRSGSSSIHETALYGKPSILVPIPETVSRDQRTNAYAYASTGAASVIEQQNLTAHLLTAEIHSIIGDRTRYETMSAAARGFAMSDAAAKIAATLIKIGHEHE